MILTFLVNFSGFITLYVNTHKRLFSSNQKKELLERQLMKWIIYIFFFYFDELFIALSNIIPFGFYAYSYWKFTIFFSKTDLHIRVLKKVLQKADPDLLNSYIQSLVARLLIWIMYKTFVLLKTLDLTVSEKDYQITQEMGEFLQQYNPKIMKAASLNNTTISETSIADDNISKDYLEKNQELILKQLEEEKLEKQEKQKKQPKIVQNNDLKEDLDIIKQLDQPTQSNQKAKVQKESPTINKTAVNNKNVSANQAYDNYKQKHSKIDKNK